MIHFIPDSPETATEVSDGEALGPYAEAVARLSSIRQALACVHDESSPAHARRRAGWLRIPGRVEPPGHRHAACIRTALLCFARGDSPMTAVEFARRNIEPHERPSFGELESMTRRRAA